MAQSRCLPLLLVSLCLSLPLSALSSPAVAAAAPQQMSCTSWSGDKLCHVDKTGVVTVGVLNGSVGAMTASHQYLHGTFTAHLKFPAANSDGTITAFYLADTVSSSNKAKNHFEIDMEFYGNTEPGQIMVATNVFFGGEQNLAQFKLPYDPSKAFHTYSIIWNSKSVTWLLDNQVIRVLTKSAQHAWPNTPLLPLLTVWQVNWGDSHPDYTHGPIATQAKNIQFQGCAFSGPTATGPCPAEAGVNRPWNRPLQAQQLKGLTPTVDGALDKALLLNAWGWDTA